MFTPAPFNDMNKKKIISLTAEQYDYIRSALEDDIPHTEIFKTAKISHTTFYRLLNSVFIQFKKNKDQRTPKEVELKVIELVPHYRNKDIQEMLGLGQATICRIIKRYGLTNKKNDKADDYNGLVGSEQYKKMRQGVTKESYRKMAETIRKLRERDALRVKYGLKPITKLQLADDPLRAKKRSYRAFLRQRGYHVAVGSLDAYYDEYTVRVKTENKRRYGFRFYPFGDQKKSVVVTADWRDKQGGFAV